MNMLFLVLFPLAVVLLLLTPFVPVATKLLTGKQSRFAFVANLCLFFGVVALSFIFPIGGVFSAAEPAAAEAVAASANGGFAEGMKYIAAALVTGMSCIGAGIAVAAAAPAAVGAFSEDPKAFGKALIFVVLGEGIALYGMLVSFTILG